MIVSLSRSQFGELITTTHLKHEMTCGRGEGEERGRGGVREKEERRGKRRRKDETEEWGEAGRPGEREGLLTKHDDINSIEVLLEQLVQSGLVS